jgi:hypothetical protein
VLQQVSPVYENFEHNMNKDALLNQRPTDRFQESNRSYREIMKPGLADLQANEFQNPHIAKKIRRLQKEMIEVLGETEVIETRQS